MMVLICVQSFMDWATHAFCLSWSPRVMSFQKVGVGSIPFFSCSLNKTMKLDDKNCISYAFDLTFECLCAKYAIRNLCNVRCTFCLCLASQCRIHVLVKPHNRKVQNHPKPICWKMFKESNSQSCRFTMIHVPPFQLRASLRFFFPEAAGSWTFGLLNLQALTRFHWIRSSWHRLDPNISTVGPGKQISGLHPH